LFVGLQRASPVEPHLAERDDYIPAASTDDTTYY